MYAQASSSPLHFLSSPLLTSIPPVRYDDKGRQAHFVESPIQRRERLAFIKRREWAQRVSTWIEESQFVNDSYKQDVLYDSAISMSQQKALWDVPDFQATDNEPYIIYSSSSNSSPSSPSSSTSALSDDSSPSMSPRVSKSSRRISHSRHRHRSLSSINEEPEEH